MPHAIRPIRPLAVLLTAALCLPALRTAAQTVTLPTCGEPASAAAYVPETDTLLLTVERLLELGVENSLRLRADRLHEEASGDRTRTARTERLPEVNVGLKGGFVGQPVVFEHGLSDATYPDAPDWSQNYAIDIVQPLYEGGRIRGSIRRAEIEERIARLGTEADCAEVKLELLRQYMNLFGLWKECDVLHRNIEESERRLKDIRQMKTEGLITNNDVLRSEMRLTDDRLSLREAIDNARIASQQLDIWMGIDEGTIILPDTTLLHLAVEPTPYEAYVDAACENDPSLRVLRAQTDLAATRCAWPGPPTIRPSRSTRATPWRVRSHARFRTSTTTTGTSDSLSPTRSRRFTATATRCGSSNVTSNWGAMPRSSGSSRSA